MRPHNHTEQQSSAIQYSKQPEQILQKPLTTQNLPSATKREIRAMKLQDEVLEGEKIATQPTMCFPRATLSRRSFRQLERHLKQSHDSRLAIDVRTSPLFSKARLKV